MNEPVIVTIDAGERPLTRSWEVCLGSGDAWSLLRADLQEQLRRAAADCGFRYLRCHGVLCDELQVLRRDRHGILIYNWQLLDAAFDGLLACGLRPFVELGFMPTALASGNAAVFYYRANVTPPARYEEWSDLIAALVAHWRDRYGIGEIREWYFEVWNEPNLDSFWAGTRDQYFELYRQTARTIKRVDSALRVGGPATTRGEWLPDFVRWCRDSRTPLDFISTHVYPDDDEFEKTDPVYREIHNRGRYLERVVERVADAMDPEVPVETRASDRLEQHWTEWNASWRWGQPIHDSTNLAAYICRALHHVHQRVDSFAFWTVSDIFNEFPYPRSTLVGGFGLLNMHGLPKPGYHAYTLLHRLGEGEMSIALAPSDSAVTDRLDCWATRSERGHQILISNYTPPDPGIRGQPFDLEVHLHVGAADARYEMVEYLVDGSHANLLAAWEGLKRPDNPTRQQITELRSASMLAPSALRTLTASAASILTFRTSLAPESVAFYELTRQET